MVGQLKPHAEPVIRHGGNKLLHMLAAELRSSSAIRWRGGESKGEGGMNEVYCV